MAGGDKRVAGVPAHLIEVADEPILHRTTRLFEHFTVTVNGPDDPRYETPHSTLHTQRSDPAWDQQAKFFSTRHLWNTQGRTVLLYGDVYYTQQAADLITEPRDGFTMYARPGPSRLTGCRYGELFAWSFHPNHHHRIIEALNETLRWKNGLHVTSRAIGWELYNAYHHLRPRNRNYTQHTVVIDDWTEDFDNTTDWNTWNENFKGAPK